MKTLSVRPNRTLGFAIAVLALGAAAAPAGGVPFVSVSTSATASVIGVVPDGEISDVSGTSLAATSADAVLTAPITTTSNFLVGAAASGMARPGILAASATADLQSTHATTLTFLADNLAGGVGWATVEFYVDDLVVTATGAGGAATVPVALHLDLSGSVSASGSLNSPPEFSWPVSAGGTATVGVSVTASAIGISTFAGTRSYSENNYGEVTAGSTGLLAGGDQLATPVFHVAVGTPFSLRVTLGVTAGAATNITHGNADAAASGHALHFASGRPVFDLPEGYTLDAPSAGIVDNAFAVPEPSTLALTLLGCALLGGRRLRGYSDRRLRHSA